MSAKDEKLTTETEMMMVRWAMCVSLLEHRRNYVGGSNGETDWDGREMGNDKKFHACEKKQLKRKH